MSRPTACPMPVRLLVVLLAGVLLAPAGLGAAARAAATEGPSPVDRRPEIVGVRVGFAGQYKVGTWTPVEVTVRGGSEPVAGELSLTVPDGDGVPSRVAAPSDRPCRLSPGQETRVVLYARFGRVEGKLGVELRAADGEVLAARQYTAAAETDFLPGVGAGRTMIVAVAADPGADQQSAGKTTVDQGGGDPLGIEAAVALQRQPPERRSAVARVADSGELPDEWIGYEGVDTLVLSTSRPEVYRRLAADNARVEALDQWVRMGGTLVVCVGAQARESRPDGGLLAPLARFLPGRFEREDTGGERVRLFPLRETGGLETYCESLTPVPLAVAEALPEVAKLIDLWAGCTVEAREADLPLVVRAPRGFGQVVFLAGDLDRLPLANWGDRPRLVGNLLGLVVEEDEAGEIGAMMHYGFDDLAGQLRSALDQFDRVGLVPFWGVVALVVAYLVLIGPGDYFLLRKVVRRMEWTWLSFPLIVLLFCVGAYVAAHRLRGDRARLNQIDLVDVAVDGDGGTSPALVRGTSWVNVFSPRAEAFDFALRPRLPDGTQPQEATVSVAWLGLPGRFLGGMDPRASNPVAWTEGYEFSPTRDAMRGVPIQVGATKSLTARWTARTGSYPEARLTDEGQVPVGTITNTLDFPLSGCLLFYSGQAYTLATGDNRDDPSRLGTLGPGETTTIDAWTWRTELKTMLTGQRLVRDADTQRQVATPYDASSVDPAYVLRMMIFFEAAGGRRYTELSNGYQGFVDLTHLVRGGRAILVAEGPDVPGQPGHGADVVCRRPDGQPAEAQVDRHLTVYRFIYEVHPPGQPAR